MKWKKHKEEYLRFRCHSPLLVYPLLLCLLSAIGWGHQQKNGLLIVISGTICCILLISLRVFYRWFKHDLSKSETANSSCSVIVFWIFAGIFLGIPAALVMLDILVRSW